ncbi:HAD family hydrolase [Desmospora profundinema]|uniref:Phosphoglycolate phosphatase-like HAD superfamily hydrolase n=1 Tax=Desmospora profundinema TaxID=1571184 RepID=A0ABU1IRM6_9BACL|nr:HAD family hydrolase [Desmospora profundinema]MDR6227378.1 phosphoglycolate phosphatase-like HAD superfamily hydrolase [Desmospora profundinema]
MVQVVLFDVDGVLLSEKRCFDSTCLSVWELLYSEHGLGLSGGSFRPAPEEKEIEEVRQAVFDDERVLEWLKSIGVNSNWDMVALLFGFQLQQLLRELHSMNPDFVEEILARPISRLALQRIGEETRRVGLDFEPRFAEVRDTLDSGQTGDVDLPERLSQLVQEWSGRDSDAFVHGSSLWKLGRDVYQEWYLGHDWFEREEKKRSFYPEKTGFLQQEIPLAEPETIRGTLDALSKEGIQLGIGTGRPALETRVPLEALGLWDAFDPNRIVTASDVRQAEEIYPDQAPLGKPHPFTYVKAYYGREKPDAKSVGARLPLPDGEQILVVGDSVADLLAARKMGCQFAATLTGPTGERARGKFEELQADYILDDVTQLSGLLQEWIRRREEENEKDAIDPAQSGSGS